YHREYLLDNISILMGGRVAEELVLGHMSTGAGNDLERATDLARKMVCEWGMSEKLGPLTFGKREEMIFLGKEIAKHQDYSEQTAQEIDLEVRRFVMEAYERSRELVKSRIGALHALAAALLEREVLEGPEIDVIITGAPA
ncbi:MAG TPA: cell division protein FtsH, partial [Candidatus Methylomirabilis sp.]|nr:cell division protein FtsH [Candidatus Methylomirabilis sp.]